MILKKVSLQDDPQLVNVKYEWARELLEQAIANTWFPNEIPLQEDMADWDRMTDEEKQAVTLFMSFFNPQEFRVNQSIAMGMYPYLGSPELVMCLTRQMWEEVNHSLTFEYVMSTIPIDREAAFNAHNDIPEMKAKEDFLLEHVEALRDGKIDPETTEGLQAFVKNIVATNIITEGIFFYSGFMIGLSFRQRGLMKNFGSLIDWVVRDESLHLQFGMNLVLTILEEHPEIATAEFAQEVREMILKSVELETAYNEVLIPKGILGMNCKFVNQYVQFIADRRLEELGFEPEYKVANPAKFMSAASDTVELVNFFEAANTSYEVNG